MSEIPISRVTKIALVLGVIGFAVSIIVAIDAVEEEQDYNSRFYDQALSDSFLIQLYMFPFNDNDTVTLYYEGEHNEVIHIVHTEPNPDYSYIGKNVYEYRFHFDHELTIEEIE